MPSEETANRKLLSMIPAELQPDYQAFFQPEQADAACLELVKAADKLCAYMRCLAEVSLGNKEFSQAEKTLRATVESSDLPEVRYFLDTFVPSFKLTLDELN